MRRLTVVWFCMGICILAGEPKLYRIDPARFSHEQGHCYIARMDLGEDGDKESRGASQLRLFEDGKELGPPHCLHKDIREKGGGRFSHWAHTVLYMSASDNTDPGTNGRQYHVASSNPDSMLGGLEPYLEAPRKHTEIIHEAHHEYTIEMGGNLDFENSRTRHNGTISVSFQPNLSLTIENTGKTAVVWPRLIVNGRGNWGTLDSLVAEFCCGAKTDQDRALFIWQAARENRYHCLPLFADDEFHDPVKMFNCYGLNLCDDMGYCGAVMFRHAGLGKPKMKEDPFVRALRGHVQAEVMVDDDFQFLDIDESVFHLDRENRCPASGDACAKDHDLVRREVHYGPVFGGWGGSETNAALFGADDRRTYRFVSGHTMQYTLRPAEKVVLRWDNIGKYACQSEEWDKKPTYFGNSKLIYSPPLGAETFPKSLAATKDIAACETDGKAALAGTSPDAFAECEIRSPWSICGGRLQGTFITRTGGDRVTVAIILRDNGGETVVWESEGPGTHTMDVVIDSALKPHVSPAKYDYKIRVRLASVKGTTGARMSNLHLETDVMAAPFSLPRLRRGTNRIVYTDDTPGDREVTVTHEWRECRRLAPPAAPAHLTYPPHGKEIRDTFVAFQWPPVEDAAKYHLQVSLRPDFRVPYRPNYDVIIDSTQWAIPYRGMFSPGPTYYWRVRAGNRLGLWGEWSQSQTFTWRGPCVPLEVGLRKTPDGWILSWKPNPRGEQPVAYEVYGSDEKGFSVHKEPYTAYVIGNVPANLLGHTTETSMQVVSAKPNHPNMNRCYYRVVAIDANGTESICSAYAELPHPHVWSVPPATVEVGKPYSYMPGVITSLGDVQHRYEKPNNQLWDREELTYSLVSAPDWLAVDSKTGAVTGTPTQPGKMSAILKVVTQKNTTYEQTIRIEVLR